jgi:hypothetical protein
MPSDDCAPRRDGAAARHLILCAAAIVAAVLSGMVAKAADTAPLERSFWLHASLGLFTQRNYFGAQFPETAMPSHAEVANAARVLTTSYGANRLYLIYHRELPPEDARTLFRWWREATPAGVEIVPALVLRMYDRAQAPIFSDDELANLAAFFHDEINPHRLAVYDIAAGRDYGPAVAVLTRIFPTSLIRLGLQPDEPLGSPFAGAVADTWSALCHGRENDRDWPQPGFGAETLQKWVRARNRGTLPVAWNLVVVAWDYLKTERGGYPGYDDAEKNMPLPTGRNRAAALLIRETAGPKLLRGFSSDLYILHENSRAAQHDGRGGSFYESLKRGEDYHGYYAAPLREIAAIFREMKERGE